MALSAPCVLAQNCARVLFAVVPNRSRARHRQTPTGNGEVSPAAAQQPALQLDLDSLSTADTMLCYAMQCHAMPHCCLYG